MAEIPSLHSISSRSEVFNSNVKQIYLDNNATTAVTSEVYEAMLPYFRQQFGNPASVHWAGRMVGDAIEQAREQVAALLNCAPDEIVFVSCGSEGDNLALKGTAEALRDKGRHIITTAVEHPAVLETCEYLEEQGYLVTYLPVDAEGALELSQLEAAIRPDTILLSVMWANNETGTIFPLEEIGQIARQNGVRFHSDVVQAVGKLKVDVERANLDLAVISGHKIGAPKGIGAIYIRRGTRLTSCLHGGHQERHRRAGTHNVPGIVGLGVACDQARRNLAHHGRQVRQLRDRLEEGILQRIPQVSINGPSDPDLRLPNTLNLSFAGVEGESLLLNLDLKGVAASSGSACNSGSLSPSQVLSAMSVDPLLAQSSVRFSLSAENTVEEIDYVLQELPAIVQRLREMSPLYQTQPADS